MARILYSAAGGAFGHATRAHSVGAGLIQRGHEVRFAASAPATGYLREHFPGLVDDLFGVTLAFRAGRLAILPTLCENLRNAWAEFRPSHRIVRRLFDEFKPDLLITDVEPWTAYWARRLGVPFVSLDNFHILTHCVPDRPPGLLGSRVSAYLATRAAYVGAKRYLITTFFRAPIRHHPTSLIDPVLRPEVYRKQTTEGDFLLAYAGAGGGHEHIHRLLKAHQGLPIRAYGFTENGRNGHITYRKHSTTGFLDDLAGCAGVLTTAGHSLICECFHLRKPMLLFPLAGQYEQCVNAHHVERLCVGRTAHQLEPGVIDSFVSGLDSHRRALARMPKATLDPVLDAIEREIP